MSGRIEARYRLERDRFSLDVDLDLPLAGITGLFGVSGAGKTSLLRCMAGLERAAEARLVIDGETLEDDALFTPVHRRRIGVVFQEPRLFNHLNVMGNILFGSKRFGSKRAAHVDEMIDLLGLEALLDRPAQSLSGGEAQRVSIARALVCQPRLVLMDEPLSSLDQARRDDVLPFLENLHASLEVPLVYVSHQPDEILRLADTLVVLEGGRVVGSGGLSDMLTGVARANLPKGMTAAVLDGVATTRDVEFGLTQVETPAGPFWVAADYAPGVALRLIIRADDVSVSLTRAEGSSIQNILPATIAAIGTENGAAMLLLLDCDGQRLVARVTRRAITELGLQTGKAVFAQVKTAAVRKAAAASVPLPA
jgi:molybdate transport system ATP-binding protein